MAFPALAADLSDPAHVIDGDFVGVAGRQIKLQGIVLSNITRT
jgi:hypothetical protein